jgi:hypothetical protein
LFPNFVPGQNTYFEWSKAFPGIKNDWANTLAVGQADNIYIAGTFNDSIDLDPGNGTHYVNSKGNRDIFLSCMSSEGILLWAISIGGILNEECFSLSIDSSGNLYLVGYFSGTVDFDPYQGTQYLTSKGVYDAFVLKLNKYGSLIWVKSIGGQQLDWGDGIKIDSLGNVYVCGSFQDTVDFDPGTATHMVISNGLIDGFVLKLNSTGDFKWVKTFGGPQYDHCISMSISNSNSIYVVGGFEDTVDFDPSVNVYKLNSVANSRDAFALKIDSLGAFVWVKSFGSNKIDQASSVVSDHDGAIVITGIFLDSVDFDPGPSVKREYSKGNSDVFILKLESSGNYIWSRSVGGMLIDEGHSIVVDLTNNIYVVGIFKDSVDFDPGIGVKNLISTGDYDGFILKLNKYGDFVWAGSIGGQSYEDIKCIALDTAGDIYSTGYFSKKCDFDPNNGKNFITSQDGTDVFTLKLSKCGLVEGVDKIIACNEYKWINGITYSSSNNSAVYTSTNSHGCDSTSSLDLIITTIDTSISVNDSILTSNALNAKYQWLDCNNNYSVLSGDTFQSYYFSKGGSFAVKVSYPGYIGCVDTSDCHTIVGYFDIDNFNIPFYLIFPNPAKDQITVELNRDVTNWQVELLDLQGRVVYVWSKLEGSSAVLRLPKDLQAGSYLVKVGIDGGVLTERLLILDSRF